jgi:hypothetical protein
MVQLLAVPALLLLLSSGVVLALLFVEDDASADGSGLRPRRLSFANVSNKSKSRGSSSNVNIGLAEEYVR